jgi:hypothetical protein
MSKDNFFKRIIKVLVGGKKASQQEAAHQQNGSMIGKLLQMVENTDEIEIPCDEVFELLDQYVELEASGTLINAVIATRSTKPWHLSLKLPLQITEYCSIWGLSPGLWFYAQYELDLQPGRHTGLKIRLI